MAAAITRQFSITWARLTPLVPSTRPSELARPRLVVASASKPSEARSRAVPASHGFGITKAPGRSCSARKAAAFSRGVFMRDSSYVFSKSIRSYTGSFCR